MNPSKRIRSISGVIHILLPMAVIRNLEYHINSSLGGQPIGGDIEMAIDGYNVCLVPTSSSSLYNMLHIITRFKKLL